jgi:phage tail-like protein
MPAPEFKVNTTRLDPYKTFRFRVKWDGRHVAGINKVSAFTRSTQVVPHRDAGDPTSSSLSPGQTEFQAITLERGVTHDAEFLQWAYKVWDYSNSTHLPASADQMASLTDFRRDIVLELYNEAEQRVMAYNVYRCWPSEFSAAPELDAGGNAVAIQTLRLENEGWERDTSFSESTEPSFTLPPE